jgi:thiol:disulfide interchange protein
VRYQPSSWLDQVVGACFALLAAAVALYLAARLIEQVWAVLLLIGIVIAVVAGLAAVLRWRRQGW